MTPEAGSAHVRRLLYILCQIEKEVGVLERVGVRRFVRSVLEVDVSYEVRVVVVQAWYDDLVEVDDDGVPISVDVPHHAVVK